jgi:hypothetical protein
MRRAVILVVTLVATLFLPAVSSTTTAQAAIPRPSAPRGLTSTIEPLARYVQQISCDPVTRWGTSNLRNLLARTYPGTWFGTTTPCGSSIAFSEHYDGRAVDWGVSMRNPVLYAYARTVLNWFLATDRWGHRYAMARRLAIQYIIYNGKIWGSWSGRWAEYNGCATKPGIRYDNYCHRDHMHISLSWNGATGATTFWTLHRYPIDYGPCRPRDLNWGGLRKAWNLYRCTWYPTVHARPGSSMLKQQLVGWSGAYLKPGRTGPIVSAVQRAFGQRPTGYYGSALTSSVMTFQRWHHIPRSGTMNQTTWRHLLPVIR